MARRVPVLSRDDALQLQSAEVVMRTAAQTLRLARAGSHTGVTLHDVVGVVATALEAQALHIRQARTER